MSLKLKLFMVSGILLSPLGISFVKAQERAFTDFRLGIVGIKTSNTGTDPLSLDVHWTPSISHQNLTVRADVGLGFVNPSGTAQFVLAGYEVYFERVLEDNLHFELGGGFQNWIEHGGIVPVASAHVLWSMGSDSPLLKNIYFGFSKSFGDLSSLQWRTGLSLRLE